MGIVVPMTGGQAPGILALGAYVPQRVLRNEDFEAYLDTSDEWIVTRTGIRERRIAAEDEYTSDLAFKAVEDLLGRHPGALEGVDGVGVGLRQRRHSMRTTPSTSPESQYSSPPTAETATFQVASPSKGKRSSPTKKASRTTPAVRAVPPSRKRRARLMLATSQCSILLSIAPKAPSS